MHMFSNIRYRQLLGEHDRNTGILLHKYLRQTSDIGIARWSRLPLPACDHGVQYTGRDSRWAVRLRSGTSPNLAIFTTGVGIKPSRQSSLDPVYHYYPQHNASDEIRDSALEAEPTGKNRSLGSEIDLVVGYEEIRNVEIALMLGYFMPAKAFPAASRHSFFAKLELQLNF